MGLDPTILLACVIAGIIIVEATLVLLLLELRHKRTDKDQGPMHCNDPVAHSLSCLDERLRMLDESI
jgi:hypothetical protein